MRKMFFGLEFLKTMEKEQSCSKMNKQTSRINNSIKYVMFVRKKALKQYNDLYYMNEISKVQGQVDYLTLKKTCCNAKRLQKHISIF